MGSQGDARGDLGQRLVADAVDLQQLLDAGPPPGATPGPVPAEPQIALILRDPSWGVPVTAISAADAAMIAALPAGTLTQAARAARAVQADHDPQPLLLHLMRSGSLTDQETVP